MQITFHGAARSVTGSKHLLELEDGRKILLDCGMFQGMGSETDKLNRDFGFDAAGIDALIVSHAHIDHTGLIPKLVKEGFNGPVFCTPATKDLTEILLYDSAEIQTYEADFVNRKRVASGLPELEPLYGVEDVQQALTLFEMVEYETPFHPIEGVTAEFLNAGHLIGSASVMIRVQEKGKSRTIAFSGDVGRARSVLLAPAVPLPQSDTIIIESTYGDKMHELSTSNVESLLEWIEYTCIGKKGKLIIPAFSVGRTQEVLYALNQLYLEKRLPEFNYYVDSPMSQKATTIIKRYTEHFSDRLQQVLKVDEDPFDFPGLKYIETVEDSRRLTEYDKPCVIISASGTADAGRVRHHILSCISDQNNTILIVGYCEQRSVGGQLLSKAAEVEIFGEACPVVAEVGQLKSMSAHADVDDLVEFLSGQDSEKVKNLFLVHGEHEVQKSFAERLSRKGFKSIQVPARHESFEI